MAAAFQSPAASILWYDLETWGTDFQSARIVQFAAIRTNLQLQIIDQPINYYVRLTRDIVPNPEATLIHAISPVDLQQESIRGVSVISEWELCQRIIAEVSQAETIVAGYNNLRFDNLVLRFAFYRNGFQPYLLDFGDDRRWDVLDLTRACHALRPQGLNWPRRVNERGVEVTSFKLEMLCQANGIQHNQAHDGLSDVQATIELARRIDQAQPRLSSYLFKHRQRSEVVELLGLSQQSDFLNSTQKPPLRVHISGMVSAESNGAEIIMPIAICPTVSNQIIAISLSRSAVADCSSQAIQNWLDLDVEAIRMRIFFSNQQLHQQGLSRLRIFTIRTKFCPIITPVSVLSEQQWQHYGGGKDWCLDQYQRACRELPVITEKLLDVFAEKPTYEVIDAELGLYQGGFYSDRDKRLLHRFQQQQWRDYDQHEFDHPYLGEIGFRIKGRYFEEHLTRTQKKDWLAHCLHNWNSGKLTGCSYQQASEDLQALLKQDSLSVEQAQQLEGFSDWLKDQFSQLHKQASKVQMP